MLGSEGVCLDMQGWVRLSRPPSVEPRAKISPRATECCSSSSLSPSLQDEKLELKEINSLAQGPTTC